VHDPSVQLAQEALVEREWDHHVGKWIAIVVEEVIYIALKTACRFWRRWPIVVQSWVNAVPAEVSQSLVADVSDGWRIEKSDFQISFADRHIVYNGEKDIFRAAVEGGINAIGVRKPQSGIWIIVPTLADYFGIERVSGSEVAVTASDADLLVSAEEERQRAGPQCGICASSAKGAVPSQSKMGRGKPGSTVPKSVSPFALTCLGWVRSKK
jgi:hypothetical protein